MSEYSTIHVPSYLNKALKQNNMIVKKENLELTSLSGSEGYGSKGKRDIELSITKANELDANSLQLRGVFAYQGVAAGKCHLQGYGVYSCVSQIRISYAGQNILLIDSRAGLLATFRRTCLDSLSASKLKDYGCLYDKQLSVGVAYDFVLDLSQYGSELQEFLKTGSLANLDVHITLEPEVKKVFYTKGDDTTDKMVTGYTLSNLHLCADFMTFQPEASKALARRIEGPNGIRIVTQSYVTTTQQLVTGATSHALVSNFRNRNLVSVFYLPVLTAITLAGTNATGIPVADRLGQLQWVEHTNGIPTNFKVDLNGGGFVNENGPRGTSHKWTHFNGLLKALRKNPEDMQLAHALADGYDGDTYQIMGASFVRGNDNLVEIINSGENSIEGGGQVNASFDTVAAQPNITVVAVGVVTSVLELKNGQAMLQR